MNKEEPGEPKEILTEIGGHKAKLILGNPADKKKVDKQIAMRMTLTYIESQRRKATPEQTIEIAEKYLKWLEKK